MDNERFADIPEYKKILKEVVEDFIGLVEMEDYEEFENINKLKINLENLKTCSRRDSNPSLRRERPKCLTGLHYRSTKKIDTTIHKILLYRKDFFIS